jgi:hypothetical protein
MYLMQLSSSYLSNVIAYFEGPIHCNEDFARPLAASAKRGCLAVDMPGSRSGWELFVLWT